jgi:hypothetical protein
MKRSNSIPGFLRRLLAGYGLAGLVAGGALTFGASGLAVFLIVWIGGAVATLLVSIAIDALRRRRAAPDRRAVFAGRGPAPDHPRQ